ncbi:hypothetical protein [Streptomyces sp. GMR22]|uniref:hypothetical protein n=1 Tax=Streptomyces sp. GMR22 TaxID=2759524 RepID=UPI0015FD8138|nr:hypothetical protein [Streptomyces sp. GMR22]MBA6439947.1 hypothetical protein [Streptomyces sp. GMR22]
MTERIMYLDRDPCDLRSRKIRVRASRWYATVVLDRDSYVDAATSPQMYPAGVSGLVAD